MKYINTTKFILIGINTKLYNVVCKNQLIISIKQINIKFDWNLGLYYACYGDHESIVKIMIEKGATKCEWCNKSIYDHIKK